MKSLSKIGIAIIFFIFPLIQTGTAQLRQLLKNLANSSTEKSVIEGIERIGKNSLKSGDEFVPVLRKLSFSDNLAEGINKNVLEFHTSKETKLKYIGEIKRDVNYPMIKEILHKKLKLRNIKESTASQLLLGGSYQGTTIDSNTLYKIYFNFSTTFATKELEKLMIYYNCGTTELTEINQIALKEKIILDQNICHEMRKNSEDFGIFEILFFILSLALICIAIYKYWHVILGLSLIGLVGYLLYLFFGFIKNLIV